MDKPSSKLLSIKEAAQYLGVSAATLRRWHNNGTFKASFLSPGGYRYYSVSELAKKTKGIFRLAQEWVESAVPFEPEHDFYCSTSDRFKTRHERMAHAIDAHTSWQSIGSLISSAAGEIGNNSFDHNLGNWPDVPGTFFAYDLGKRVIVLADRGVGVLATLRLIRPSLATDEEAVHVAFTEILTSRATEHRGNGLKFVKEALTQAGADLLFQSGNAILEIKKGVPGFKIKKTETPIRGSLSLIKF